MRKNGPIIIIDDEAAHRQILDEVFKNLKYTNKLIYFINGEEALEYFEKTRANPFLILSDINMPKVDGFELRNKIYSNKRLRIKCIPFLFFTTYTNKKGVDEAYSLAVQGFFLKPFDIHELEKTIKTIVEYWQVCVAPGDYEL